MTIDKALEIFNQVQSEFGGIGTLELCKAYKNGRIALTREEDDAFERVLRDLTAMFAPAEAS